MDAMVADTKTSYHVGVGPVPKGSGGGRTDFSASPSTVLDRIFRRPRQNAVVFMMADPSSKIEFFDICEKPFLPSTLRILGHELGHGYTFLQGGFVGVRVNYDKAIEHENIIAKELDPNAPIRAISDHGSRNPF